MLTPSFLIIYDTSPVIVCIAKDSFSSRIQEAMIIAYQVDEVATMSRRAFILQNDCLFTCPFDGHNKHLRATLKHCSILNALSKE